MFQETDRKFQETDRKFQETDRKFHEMELSRRQEAENTFAEIRRMSQEVFAMMKETDLKFQDTDRRFKETDLRFQETDRKLQEVGRRIGQLGSRLGEFVEEMVAPACERLFAERGIPIHRVFRRMTAKLSGGRFMEIDLVVENSDSLGLVEVKSKLTVSDVQEFMEDLSLFKEFFPRYADMRVIGAVAAMVVEENVLRFAMHQGLFVIVQAGENVRIANDPAFVPRVW
ncbi:MAG: hypothetical protein G8237_10630 [Magnetococcales bacterium]|nr:hypothetical protein [Magnetococcales bacterium]NGZ06800.1 hypothetical protein [Magnetococcales bacterium]